VGPIFSWGIFFRRVVHRSPSIASSIIKSKTHPIKPAKGGIHLLTIVPTASKSASWYNTSIASGWEFQRFVMFCVVHPSFLNRHFPLNHHVYIDRPTVYDIPNYIIVLPLAVRKVSLNQSTHQLSAKRRDKEGTRISSQFIH
jgi:hypothetical protein